MASMASSTQPMVPSPPHTSTRTLPGGSRVHSCRALEGASLDRSNTWREGGREGEREGGRERETGRQRERHREGERQKERQTKQEKGIQLLSEIFLLMKIKKKVN